MAACPVSGGRWGPRAAGPVHVSTRLTRQELCFRDLDGYVIAQVCGSIRGANLTSSPMRLLSGSVGRAKPNGPSAGLSCGRALRELETLRRECDLHRPTCRAPGSCLVPVQWPAPPGRTVSVFGPWQRRQDTLADGLIVSATSGREIVPVWRAGSARSWSAASTGRRRTPRAGAAPRTCPGLRSEDLATRFEYRRMSAPWPTAADEVGRWVVEQRVRVLSSRRPVARRRPTEIPARPSSSCTKPAGIRHVELDRPRSGRPIADPAPAPREYGSWRSVTRLAAPSRSMNSPASLAAAWSFPEHEAGRPGT